VVTISQICSEVVIITYVCVSSQVAPDCKVIIFPKDELDKANKDKKHFPPNFQVCKHSCHGYWVGGASQREGLPLTEVERNYTHMHTPSLSPFPSHKTGSCGSV